MQQKSSKKPHRSIISSLEESKVRSWFLVLMILFVALLLVIFVSKVTYSGDELSEKILFENSQTAEIPRG